LDWGGASKTPVHAYSKELLIRLTARLFIGTPNIGGKVEPNQAVPGLTTVKVDDVIYRAHPSFCNNVCWYDWAYFNWEGFDDPIVARIMMIVDLSNVALDVEPDMDPDEAVVGETAINNAPHLTNEIWVLVLAAETLIIEPTDVSDYHFQSSIHKRIKLHNKDEVFIVPLSSLVGPAFVVYNNNYVNGRINEMSVGDSTCYVVTSKSNWPNAFLPSIIN
jgi:hypothetical protein